MQTPAPVVLSFAFSLFVACSFVFFVSGLYLLFFKIQKANRLFKHPYLAERSFQSYPWSIRMGIVLDYFLRLTFPKSKVWLAGHSNRLLAHVHPQDIPTDVRWPIMGLWGSCLIGMVAMLTMWFFLLQGGAK
jgi:hypothetical protein